MNDAPRRVRGLAADRKPAFEVAIERHAIAQQIFDACGSLAGQSERDRFIDQAAADRDRIGRMGFGAVAFSDGGGDAALRPCGGCALAERSGRSP